MKIDIEHPLMIIGVGRSGTTLLQAILNAHPEICFPPESHFIRDFVANQSLQQLYRREGLFAIRQALEESRSLGRLGISSDDALAPFESNPSGFSFGALFKRYLCLYAERHNKWRVGEKDPSNTFYLPTIHHIFPNAHILHLIRDPRDVILSRMNSVLNYGKSVKQWAYNYRRAFRTARKIGKKLFGVQYHEVFYENLISDTKKAIISLCSEIKIDFDSQMLSFQEGAKHIVGEGELAWKKNVMRPILKDNAGKWKSGLTREQIRDIETICYKVFHETPYKRSDLTDAMLWPGVRYALFSGQHFSRMVLRSVKDGTFFAKVNDRIFP